MAAYKNQISTLSEGLQAEVNKRTSVSIFERFGKHSPLFQKQFDDTRRSIRSYNKHVERIVIEEKLRSVDDIVTAKSRELQLLSKYDTSKINQIENLCDRVTELKEDLDIELDILQQRVTDDSRNEETETGRDDGITDTIMAWKIQTLPRIPAS